ncbi:MAG: YbaN family protein [Betaproteobacteria bacterium]|nr:YbaN family protein [Betaproteobacteria bacterium]
MKLLLWRGIALVALVLGAVGVVVPGLPTVPFLLLAAWAASRGWPALEVWLLQHPRHGATVRQWRERGAVPRRAKWLSSVMMAASAAIMWAVGVPGWAFALAVVTMATVAAWLWRRPEA